MPQQVHVVAPNDVGKLVIRVLATKSPNFSGVQSMQLRLLGQDFWRSVEQTQGRMLATIGQALLPLSVIDKRDVNLGAVSHGHSEIELAIEPNFLVKRDVLFDNLNKLDGNATFSLQVEGKLSTGRRVMLLKRRKQLRVRHGGRGLAAQRKARLPLVRQGKFNASCGQLVHPWQGKSPGDEKWWDGASSRCHQASLL